VLYTMNDDYYNQSYPTGGAMKHSSSSAPYGRSLDYSSKPLDSYGSRVPLGGPSARKPMHDSISSGPGLPPPLMRDYSYDALGGKDSYHYDGMLSISTRYKLKLLYSSA